MDTNLANHKHGYYIAAYKGDLVVGYGRFTKAYRGEKVSDSLGFLLSDVSRQMRRKFNERARDIGVTRPQWRVLTVLSRNEGANQGSIADLLEVEPITVARMVDRLQDAGLVERRADPADRRAWLLYLTPKAWSIVADLRHISDTMFAEVVSGIDPAALQQVREVMEMIRANITRLPTAGKDLKDNDNG